MTTEEEFTDADDLLSQHEEQHYATLTLTPAALEQMKARKVHQEQVAVCAAMLRQQDTTMMDHHPTTKQKVMLCYASALEGLGKRGMAISMLQEFLLLLDESCHHQSSTSTTTQQDDYNCNVAVTLVLAKLLFKDNRKAEAQVHCDCILNHIRQRHPKPLSECRSRTTTATATNDDGEVVVFEDYDLDYYDDYVDAFHLAGWVRIHADNHTDAYRLWEEGHAYLPSCRLLEIQHNKRSCWDDPSSGNEMPSSLEETSSSTTTDYSRNEDLDAFYVAPSRLCCTPALALFDPSTQQKALVFRSRQPVLSKEECQWVITQVQTYHTEHCDGKWSTVRHSSVKTTDVAVEDIESLRPWLKALLHNKLYPLLAAAFPKLVDGSTIGIKGERMRVHDAFIVRYDADIDQSCSLPEHSDTSAMSFTVALNSRGTDFDGGGTWFEALGEDNNEGMVVDADCGHAVAFAGPLRHAGYPVTSGCRIILVLFLYIEDYAYGHFLEDYVRTNINTSSDDDDGCCCDTLGDGTGPVMVTATPKDCPTPKPSGDMPGGFVVYNQTVELVNMLNRGVASVLE